MEKHNVMEEIIALFDQQAKTLDNVLQIDDVKTLHYIIVQLVRFINRQAFNQLENK